MIKLLYLWVISASILTIVVGLLYVMVQQNYRQSANDPQIQLSEDTALLLAESKPPSTLLPNNQVDITKSLAHYVVIYDDSGKPVAGSGLLNNELPSLPAGVFSYTLAHGQDRITWQPLPNVRSAIVVTHYNSDNPGYVMVGRSLREVESREINLTRMLGAGWLFGLFVLAFEFVALGLAQSFLPRHKH